VAEFEFADRVGGETEQLVGEPALPDTGLAIATDESPLTPPDHVPTAEPTPVASDFAFAESLPPGPSGPSHTAEPTRKPANPEANPAPAPPDEAGRPPIFAALAGGTEGASTAAPKAGLDPRLRGDDGLHRDDQQKAGSANQPERPAIFAALAALTGAPAPEANKPAATGPTGSSRKKQSGGDNDSRATRAGSPASAPARAPAHLKKSSGGGAKPPGGNGGGGNGSPSGPGQPPGTDGGTGAAPAGARIGDRLVEMGLISRDQLQVALYEKKRTNKLLGTLLVDLGFITEAALSAVLASSSGFEKFDLQGTVVEPDLLKRIPKEVALRYRVLPVALEGTSLRLAMADIYDVLALDQTRKYAPPGCEIIPLVSSEAEILQAIDQFYGYEFSIDGILRELETGKHDISASAVSGEGYVHPLVRLVNAIVLDAVKAAASDIHLEPEGAFVRLRYRIDGVMQQIRTFHKDHWPAISHRIKIVSGMNIADKLNPQDGRFGFSMGSRKIDFRVSAMPTVHGENIVIRILDKSRSVISVDALGLSDSNHALLHKLIRKPEGIIIVTGPTGSGKTTTLYAVLNHLNSLERNIMTLEDPVEYEVQLMRQGQVRDGTAMNFADGVRSILRQDPDIIFIGEVRDNATAAMALRASMTGHQVFTTLHTNDAAGAIPRLHDLGLSHGLLAGNIIGIIAQRLVRSLCACATQRPASAEECRIFGIDAADPPLIGEPAGCPDCRFTGYKGRLAVHEILPMNRVLDEMVLSGASLAQVRAEAREFGYIPILEDGVEKILQGLITLDSLGRAVDITERL
jgi:type II secretory ATPase GspE/PulE/Tfp pilus assembly ATPase PilB-like protein